MVATLLNKDRRITKRIVQHAEGRGCKGLFITVAPQPRRREKGTPLALCILIFSSNANLRRYPHLA